MNNLEVIACGSGLQDGLNPCIFITCSVFIIFGLWLKKSFTRISWLIVVFGFTYGLNTLDFNFGPGQIFVLQKIFVLAAKILYFVLGAWSFVLGVLFLKDWFLLSRGGAIENQAGEKLKASKARDLAAYLATVFLAVVLSALATLWPINKYIMVLGNVAFLKGQWQTAMPVLASYVLMSMWPLWFVCAILSIKDLRPSLLKILCAAVFFTASSSMILMFKQ